MGLLSTSAGAGAAVSLLLIVIQDLADHLRLPGAGIIGMPHCAQFLSSIFEMVFSLLFCCYIFFLLVLSIEPRACR